jgi:hypothetical protein
MDDEKPKETDDQTWHRLISNNKPYPELQRRPYSDLGPQVVKEIKAEKAVRKIARRLRKLCPWITDADAPTVRAWAEYEFMCA